MLIDLYKGIVYLRKDEENEIEQLYITHLVQDNGSEKKYYYTSKYVIESVDVENVDINIESTWKKGNGFITIDEDNKTVHICMLNSRYGRFKSVDLKAKSVFGGDI